jgi:ABC-type enterochelin transport system ATPase subunit
MYCNGRQRNEFESKPNNYLDFFSMKAINKKYINLLSIFTTKSNGITK